VNAPIKAGPSKHWVKIKNRQHPAIGTGDGAAEVWSNARSVNDAERHTHKATTSELQELWAKIANEYLERTGDEGRAIREANAVIARLPS